MTLTTSIKTRFVHLSWIV